jgi:hypothetical protein
MILAKTYFLIIVLKIGLHCLFFITKLLLDYFDYKIKDEGGLDLVELEMEYCGFESLEK